MNTIFKSLLVWLLLIAVPFQGFASATMMVCAPVSLAGAAAANAHRMDTGSSGHCPMMADRQADETGASMAGHQADAKCNSCASCHVGAALTSSDAIRVPLETQQFHSIPFDLGFVADVDLDVPERPPQTPLI